jgi:hypothetical protein
MWMADNDIKSELSYAYLHAVAAHAGCTCQVNPRVVDNMGLDATLRPTGDFGRPPFTKRFAVDVQLKATSAALGDAGAHWSFGIGVRQYDDLRSTNVIFPPLLVVLHLPPSKTDWLSCTTESLILRRCAFWVSLYNAEPSGNKSEQTVYLPKSNVFTADALRRVMAEYSQGRKIEYAPPTT